MTKQWCEAVRDGGRRRNAPPKTAPLPIFAAASGNSTRNATILFAGTDPFNLDETASSYFVYADPCSGGRLFGEAALGARASWANPARRAIFSRLESARECVELSPSGHARSGYPHGPGECAEGEGSAESGDPGVGRTGLPQHSRQGDAGARLQLLSWPPDQHGCSG